MPPRKRFKGEAMAEATVNGVWLAYEVHGQGEPILFLAGLAKEAWFGGPAPAIAEPGYQVVLVDNRGFGRSEAPPVPYAIADLAADTAGLNDDAGAARVS
jgi:pimeloyl-ACP methyl ester carboxylesterase